MRASEVQREGSTLSHTPDRLQVLLIMVVVLGQQRVWVVPAGVLGQERNSVVSALHLPAAAQCKKRKELWRDRRVITKSCVKQGSFNTSWYIHVPVSFTYTLSRSWVIATMTVKSCLVCGNSQSKDPNTSFYQFPSDPGRRVIVIWLWVFDLQEGGIKPHHRVCSRHFPFPNGDAKNDPRTSRGRSKSRQQQTRAGIVWLFEGFREICARNIGWSKHHIWNNRGNNHGSRCNLVSCPDHFSPLKIVWARD